MAATRGVIGSDCEWFGLEAGLYHGTGGVPPVHGGYHRKSPASPV